MKINSLEFNIADRIKPWLFGWSDSLGGAAVSMLASRVFRRLDLFICAVGNVSHLYRSVFFFVFPLLFWSLYYVLFVTFASCFPPHLLRIWFHLCLITCALPRSLFFARLSLDPFIWSFSQPVCFHICDSWPWILPEFFIFTPEPSVINIAKKRF